MKRFLFLLFFHCKIFFIIIADNTNKIQHIIDQLPSTQLKSQHYDLGKAVTNFMDKPKKEEKIFYNGFGNEVNTVFGKIFIFLFPFTQWHPNKSTVSFITEKIKQFENNYIPQLIDPIKNDWKKYRSINKDSNEDECVLEFLKIKILQFYLQFFNLKIDTPEEIKKTEEFFAKDGDIFKNDLTSILKNEIPNQIHLIQEMMFQDFKPQNIDISKEEDEDVPTKKCEMLTKEINTFCEYFEKSPMYRKASVLFCGAKTLIEIDNESVAKSPFVNDDTPITTGGYSFNQFSFIEKLNYIYLVFNNFKAAKITVNSITYTININQIITLFSKMHKLMEGCNNQHQESFKKFKDKSILIHYNKIFANCAESYFQLKFYLDLFNCALEQNKAQGKLDLMDSASNKLNPAVVEKIKKAQDSGIKDSINGTKNPISTWKFFGNLMTCVILSSVIANSKKLPSSFEDESN